LDNFTLEEIESDKKQTVFITISGSLELWLWFNFNLPLRSVEMTCGHCVG